MKTVFQLPVAALILTLGSLPLLGSQSMEARQTGARPVVGAEPPATQPSTTPSARTASADQPVAGKDDAARYIIGTEDTLQIIVWKEPGFSGNVPVRPDGMISLALVGDLKAAGFTPMQLGADIATRLKKYITDPNVTVSVVSVRAKQIYLLGEVGHVGPLTFIPEMTPLQAIAAAGGLSPFAKPKNIYILRGEAGRQKKIPFNYKKAIKDGDQQGISLVPGDTIVVP